MTTQWSTKDEVSQVKVYRPHVLILGAGASIAALPNGDKHGRRLPSMDNFVEILDLSGLLSKGYIDFEGKNFEDVYDDLYRNENYSSLRRELEQRVYDYFSSLELPDEPTLYDHLVLGLRDKDVIVTFNWDPFLTQAFRRNAKRCKLPRLYFLHGNVAIGYCVNDQVMGAKANSCSRCGRVLSPLKLLYPISEKNYDDDGFMSTQWQEVNGKLANAFMITIFRYRAPKSDVRAIELLKSGWGDKYQRNLEQTEMINIEPEDELLATLQAFVHTHHYDVHDDFYDSWIANHPRRTGEAWLNQNIDCIFLEKNPIPRNLDFPNLWDWFERFREAEEQCAEAQSR